MFLIDRLESVALLQVRDDKSSIDEQVPKDFELALLNKYQETRDVGFSILSYLVNRTNCYKMNTTPDERLERRI